MKVVVAGYQAISILHGGPNTQLRKTVRFLGEHGVDVSFFDPWTPLRASSCDLFHLFAANIGTYHLAREIQRLRIPLVVSPIVYSTHSARFVHMALMVNRLLQRRVPGGIWSDYLLTAEICAWAAKLLPNSRAEADLVRDGYGADPAKITVVPNGVDERFASADPGLFRKKFGLT